MRELWIPVSVIGLFYLFFLLRSPVRQMRTLDGLIWLPPAALMLTAGIFPAYGFRPEAVPLLIYGIVLNFLNLPALGMGVRRRQDTDLSVWGPLFVPVSLGMFVVVMVLALVFAPMNTDQPAAGTLTVREGGREYLLRVYGTGGGESGGAGRPLLLLVPPPTGSVPVMEGVCGELARRGFTVLTYSRRGFDAPALGEKGQFYLVSPAEQLRRLWLFSAGTRLKKANNTGRAMEAGRREDVEFLLSWLREHPDLGGLGAGPGPAGGPPLFLAGYGAGGSALIFLAGSPGFALRNPTVRGIIAVESFLWSSYREPEKLAPLPPPGPGLPGRLRWLGAGIGRWFAGLGPRKMAGWEPVSPPELPLMVILSGRSLRPGDRERLYGAIRGLSSQGGILFLAAEGTGPLDYTDCPTRYPLFSALFPGEGKRPWNGGDFAGGAAALMTGFASLLLEAGGETDPPPRLERGGVPSQGLHIESRAWNLPDPGYIVVP